MKRGLRNNSANAYFAYQNQMANFGPMGFLANQGTNIMNQVRKLGKGAGNVLLDGSARAFDAGQNLINQGGANSFRGALGQKVANVADRGLNTADQIMQNSGKVGAGILGAGAIGVGGAGLMGANALQKRKQQQQMMY